MRLIPYWVFLLYKFEFWFDFINSALLAYAFMWYLCGTYGVFMWYLYILNKFGCLSKDKIKREVLSNKVGCHSMDATSYLMCYWSQFQKASNSKIVGFADDFTFIFPCRTRLNLEQEATLALSACCWKICIFIFHQAVLRPWLSKHLDHFMVVTLS